MPLDWHQHPFTAMTLTPLSCVTCGHAQLAPQHFGPFQPVSFLFMGLKCWTIYSDVQQCQCGLTVRECKITTCDMGD